MIFAPKYFIAARLISAVLVLIALLSYVGFKLWNGESLSALAILLTGLLLLWAIILGPLSLLDYEEIVKVIFGMIAILSIGNVLLTSKATDYNIMANNVDLFRQALTVNNCPISVQPDNSKRLMFRKLKEVLVAQCALQNIENIRELTTEATKAHYLDPITGLADNLYSDFGRDEPVTCSTIAKQMDELCPGLLQ